MSIERGDTEIETRVRIAEIDGAVRGLTEDVHEIKDSIRTIGVHIEAFSKTQALFLGLQQTVNDNARRSDERLSQLLDSRREDMNDYKKWREATDRSCAGLKERLDEYKGSLNALRTFFSIVFGVAIALVGWYLADNSSRIAHNADRISTVEQFLARDLAFKAR